MKAHGKRGPAAVIPAPIKTFLSFVLPGGLVLTGAAVLVRWAGLSSPLVADYYAWAALLAALALAWRFQSSRALFAILVLALAEKALWLLSDTPAGSADAALNVIALLLPLNLVFFELIGECGLGLTAVTSGAGIVAIEAAFVAIVSRAENAGFALGFGRAWLPTGMFSWTRVPQLGLLAFAAAYAVLATRMVTRRKPVEIAYFWAVCAAFLGLHFGGREGRVFLSSGVLLMAVAMVETGYRLAYHDELTGLPGRRAFHQALLTLAETYSIAMVDVDHFKKFNDTYGHDTGDQVLRMVAARLAQVAGGGRAFRYGGEEFVILFNGLAAADAAEHLEAVRESIATSEFLVRGPDRSGRKRSERRYASPGRKPVGHRRGTASVTVSIGAAQSGGRLRTPELVIAAADQALYQAKDAGRNRVIVAPKQRAVRANVD
jgi:diguanylate cyclase (GGDEF)-like protein